jgi:UTP:GlnB (protein PII) uridylyltransferase
MSSSPGFPSERPASGFQVSAGATADIGVTLWGDLGLGWFGKLSTALARRGLSIHSAQATRTANDNWTGSLELLVSSSTSDPYGLDYLELAREQPVSQNQEPSFERFRVERTSTGALELRFSAKDQLGLLSGLLDRLEFLGLFPERLRVATDGDRVEDTLWLRGVAGNGPSAQTEEALRALMLRLTRPQNGGGH